ncbi:MAG: CBS domain-containing protein [Desulfarculaceae bacterium]|nr:CBS domain-containing protein [Desulfarculaceae bacterium]MCF8073312.1 CBS domain-containing protein [Desulfarculaceae bacterium]MCF8100908.1 CBS domain-containing protein [Desulfarculaceae bacterium]MCF8116636.1 CBS domain-containing protein [Desulfarculaceae bacterium]
MSAAGPYQKPPRDVEVITTHVNADYDALASMLAAAKLHPEAMLVFPGAQERNLRNFFVESVSFLYNFVKIKQVPFDRVGRLILVDNRQKDRIGDLARLADDPEVEVIAYDHHPDSDNDVKADFQIVEMVGSTVTIMTKLLRKEGITLSEDEATLLALGIYEDTGSFHFISATPADFEAAAWLVSQGAMLNVISDLITRELSADEVGLLHDLIEAAETLNVGGTSIVVSQVSRDAYVPEFAVLVHKFMDMENLDALFTLARMEGRVYLVARSRLPEVDAGAIASAMGGGGHPSAASATLKDMTLVEASERLKNLLRSSINPTILARDLMTAPVITVPPETTLKEAEGVLTRYNVNVLPVSGGGEVRGIITRQTVEKAVFHGLGDLSVVEYMTPGGKVLAPEATLVEVEEAVVERRQRLVPVMEGSKLLGVVTRTDLLNTLIENPLITERHAERYEGPRPVRHKNIKSLMGERLPRGVIKTLKEMGSVAQDLGFKAFLVGGSVRDLFLRRDNLDLDIVVEGDGIAFARRYGQLHSEVKVRTHKKFNTANLTFDRGLSMDVATARLEYYDSPAALPVVELSSLKLDLYRRDFTINTLAVVLNSEGFGQLVDFFDGLRDIKEKAVRVLHNLSFVEDPTRVFRAVRFEQRFGFRIGKLTEGLIKNAVKIDAFKRLSSRRLFGEFRQMLEEERAVDCLRRLRALRLLYVFHAELRLEPKDEELLGDLEEALAWHRLSFLDQPVSQWLVYYLGLGDSLEREQRLALSKRLGFSPKQREEMENERSRALQSLNLLQRKKPRASEIYFWLQPLEPEYQLFVMAKATRQWAKRAVSQYLTSLVRVRPDLGGGDLKDMGFSPGPLFKRILDRLQAARLDGEVLTREQELQLVKREFSPEEQSA